MVEEMALHLRLLVLALGLEDSLPVLEDTLLRLRRDESRELVEETVEKRRRKGFLLLLGVERSEALSLWCCMTLR